MWVYTYICSYVIFLTYSHTFFLCRNEKIWGSKGQHVAIVNIVLYSKFAKIDFKSSHPTCKKKKKGNYVK